MPEQITVCYELTGQETVVIYSEQEMADVLDLTCAQLRRELAIGSLSYHAHPSATENKEYQFLQSTCLDNFNWWECIQAGGHFYGWKHYAHVRKLICTECGKEKYD